jgi:predicted phage tail protein
MALTIDILNQEVNNISLEKLDRVSDVVLYYQVTDSESAKHLLQCGAETKKLSKELDAIRKDILKPAREFTAKVQSIFNPYIAKLEEIESFVKKKLDHYQATQERINKEEALRKQEALAIIGIENTPLLEKEVKITDGSASMYTRTDWKYDIMDHNEIPREFLTIDEKKVKASIKAGVRNIPGLKIYSAETAVLKSS